MPKRGENIYKRKDGRWEGRYIRGTRPPAGLSMAMFMPAAIGSAAQNAKNAWTLVKKRRWGPPRSRWIRQQSGFLRINRIS